MWDDHWGNHNIAPHCRVHLNTLGAQERCTRPSAIDSRRSSSSFMLFSILSSVSLYAIHTRTYSPNSIHRHVLQPFALPRRVTAFTSASFSVSFSVLHFLQAHDFVTNGVLDPQPVSCFSNARSRAHPDRCRGVRLDIYVDGSSHLFVHVLRADSSC